MNIFEKLLHIEEVSAHCDVPCGIYDPFPAQIAALTTVRMIDQMTDILASDHSEMEKLNTFTRLVAVKEEHAEKVKHEIRVIWGDFIKADQIKAYPQIHELTHEIMQLGSKVKQAAKREDAVKLVEKVNEFAKIFWAIKGEETVEMEAPYKPNLKLVYRKAK
ncbi:MAG: superoxide dismutase, Ni [Eubacteriales bacterium]|nr:superoxide dismutase, Ni [Eubacteriales bacterium]